MSEQQPDPGAQPTPQPQASESDPEPDAANTEVFASAEFATGPQAAAAPEGFTEPEPATDPGAVAAPEPTSTPAAESVPAAEPMPVTEPAPTTGSAPAGEPAPAEQPPARRARRRTGLIVGLGVGYAVLAAGTAFGVIATRSPAPVDVTAVNASAYAAAGKAASASAAAQPKSSPSSSTAAAVAASAAPTKAASTKAAPTSTVTGTVSDGVHHGDLRYFLEPAPQGPSSVQGDPDGTTETLDQVAQDFYGGSSTVEGYLRKGGFKAACTRTYQDSTIGANVTVELIQFDSSSEASDWMSAFTFNGPGSKKVSVPGESSADGWSFSSDGGSGMLGVYRDGDTFYQVQIYSTSSIPATDLGRLMSAQHSRLANG